MSKNQKFWDIVSYIYLAITSLFIIGLTITPIKMNAINNGAGAVIILCAFVLATLFIRFMVIMGLNGLRHKIAKRRAIKRARRNAIQKGTLEVAA